MTEFIWLVVGLLLGGCIGIVLLCCFQINRIASYEQEIQRLKKQLGSKEKTE